ncbi:hypothetical protein O181_013122 [Austropuccinia psidii MF-1]|uniref:Uncharacterized protein n=1 Tax=Austropuccinia psidii MF-1 TaxID=1389203 RepID=A0A9Q3BXP1_9BASI|nr:hypothetical protein [Austropuccinia psidii MF-1]
MSWSKAQCESFWWSHDRNTFCNSSSESSVWSTSPKRVKCSAWPKCYPMLCAYRDDLAIAQQGAFNIAISIAQQLCNSNVQRVSMSIMTPKPTGTVGQPKVILYSLFVQPPGRNAVTNLNSLVFRCRSLYALSRVSPASAPCQQPMLVMLANKYTRNACLLSNPSDHTARGVPAQDALARTPLWLTMMKLFPRGNGHRDPKQAGGKNSGQLALSPQILICPPPS